MSRTDRKDFGSLADFDKPELKVAIPRGSTAAKAVAKYTPKATIVEFSGTDDIVSAIDAGQVDAICTGDALANWMVKNSVGGSHHTSLLGAAVEQAIGL